MEGERQRRQAQIHLAGEGVGVGLTPAGKLRLADSPTTTPAESPRKRFERSRGLRGAPHNFTFTFASPRPPTNHVRYHPEHKARSSSQGNLIF
jgi:hypothetical protein